MSEEFEAWLAKIGLEEHVEAFRANGVDFRSVALLSEADLTELGMSLGHRRILLAELSKRGSAPELAPVPAQATARSTTLEGERRQLTVVFCDIVGATKLSTEIDPEDLREIIQRYQNAVVAAVVRYGGHVAKFLGDGILAYFGWPQAYEDQAERAVLAAFAAVEETEKIKIGPRRTLRARAGIATGEVVIGDIVGDRLTDAEAVIGETPNLAARLQSAARPGEVVIEAATRTLIATAFTLEVRGDKRLKGFEDPIDLWIVRGEGDAPSRFKAMRGGLEAAIAGREAEMAQLHAAWGRVQSGKGQAVVLSGDSGIGKSALVTAFAQSIAQEVKGDWRCQCSPFHSNTAFYPVMRLLMRAASIDNTDTPAARRAKLDRWWNSMGGDRRDLPVMGALVNSSSEDPSVDSLTPPQLRERISEVLTALIASVDPEMPLLYVVEDAHWIDPSTLGLVRHLASLSTTLPFLLLVTSRPTDQPVLSEVPGVIRMPLTGLPDATAQSVVHAVGGRRLDAQLISSIVERADGNPLCLEELTKSVLDSEFSTQDLTEPDRIPMTLQSSLTARLDQLNAAKELAQIGAVIGHRFSYQLLRQVYPRSDDEIAFSIGQLLQSGLVKEEMIGGDLYYRFRHALVHDAAYSTILRADRRRLHEKIVSIVAKQDDAFFAVDRKLHMLAHHATRAEMWGEAFGYCHDAAREAAAQSALREAVSLYGQALEVAEHLPEAEVRAEELIDVRFELRNALWALGANEEIIGQLTEAENLAGRIGDRRRLGWVSVYRGASLWLVGRNAEAQEATRQAVTIAQEMSDLPLLTAADFYFGCTLVQHGDFQAAVDRFMRILDALHDKPVDEFLGLPFAPTVVVRSWLIWSLAELGRFDEAMAVADEGTRLAKQIKHPFSHAHLLYDVGYLHIVREDFAEADRVLSAAREMTQRWQLGNVDLFVTGFLGYARLRNGDVEDGTRLLADCVQRYEDQGSGLFHALAVTHLAEAHVMKSDHQTARDLATRALALARQRGERAHMAYALVAKGDVSASDDAEAARDDYRQAGELAERCGMMPLVKRYKERLASLA